MTDPVMRLYLFGGLRVARGDDSHAELGGDMANAVLLALALRGAQGMARRSLATLIWPDMNESDGLTRLRQEIHTIRRVFEDGVLVHPARGWIVLSPDLVWCDCAALEAAAANLPVAHLPSPRGAFVATVPRAGGDYSNWVQTITEGRRVELLATLSGALESGELSNAISDVLITALGYLDPLDERALVSELSNLARRGELRRMEILRGAYDRRHIDQHGEAMPAELAAQVEMLMAQAGRVRRDGAATPARPQLRPAPVVRPVVAISAFENLSRDAQVDWVGEALAEHLLQRLSGPRWYELRAENLSAIYKPPGVEAVGIDRLPPTYRISGTFVAGDNAVRVTVRLIDATTREPVMRQQYDEQFDNVVRIGDDIADRIAATIPTEVMSAEGRIADAGGRVPTDPDAWSRLMKAQYLFWRTSRSNNAEARALVDEVLASGERSVLAHVIAAFTRLLDLWSFWSRDMARDLAEALDLSRRAVTHDPQDPWAHFCLGTAHGANGRLDAGISQLDRALELQPTFTGALGERARLKVFNGDLDGGTADAVEAMRLNPRDPHFALWKNAAGLAALLSDDLAAAENWARQALSVASHWYQNHLLLAAVLQRLDRHEEGRDHVEEVLRVVPELNATNLRYGHPFAVNAHQRAFVGSLSSLGLPE